MADTEPATRRLADELAEDWDAPGWRDALDRRGHDGWATLKPAPRLDNRPASDEPLPPKVT